MMYIIVSGDDSDYYIQGAYDDKDLAQAYVDAVGDVRIEPCELNAHADELRSGRVPFHIYAYYRDGGELEFRATAFPSSDWDEDVRASKVKTFVGESLVYTTCVYAKDKRGAILLAMGKIVQYEAQKEREV